MLSRALSIAPDLRLPILKVPSWHPTVERAAVPEAAVDKHRDASPRKRDVRPNDAIIEAKRIVNAITQTPPEEFCS